MASEPQNFCVIPFSSMVVRANGTVSPCCDNTSEARSADGEMLHLYKDRIGEGFRSPFFREVREAMLAGKRHPSCQSCWRAEDLGLHSKRQHENGVFADVVERVLAGEIPEQPVDLSLNLGNQCNLKCRICGPVSSSKWAAEFLDLYGTDHVPKENRVMRALEPEAARALNTNWPYRDEHFTRDMLTWLPHVRRLEFLGGEPFLNRKQFEIVKFSAEQGYSSEQALTFVTNGSLFPPEDALEDWRKFRSVNVHISLDGIGPHFEYQRHGAKWSDVLAHFDRYRALPQVAHVNLMLTVSMFTVFYLPEIFAFWSKRGVEVASCAGPGVLPAPLTLWDRVRSAVRAKLSAPPAGSASQIFPSYLYIPERFDIRGLPPALKESIVKRFRAKSRHLSPFARARLDVVAEHLQSEHLPGLWLNALENIWFHDQYRKQSFEATFPEFTAEAKRLGVWRDYETQREAFRPPKSESAAIHAP